MDARRMEHQSGTNIIKSACSAVNISVYFENHKILEIVTKIIYEAAKSRPPNFTKWLAENLKKISNELLHTRTFILAPPVLDVEKLLDLAWKNYNIPAVLCNEKCDTKLYGNILKDLEFFLDRYDLHEKNKIFINFPKNCNQANYFRNQSTEPTCIVEIRGEKIENEDLADQENFEEVKHFYRKDIQHCIYYGSHSIKPNQRTTVDEILNSLVKLASTKMAVSIEKFPSKNYCYRIVVYGRRGSGSREHARALAKRYHLIFLNSEDLITSCLNEPNGLGYALRESLSKYNDFSSYIIMSVIFKRLLKSDCVTNGWILCGFPFDEDGFRTLMENFIMPPNRILYIHARERVCIRRLVNEWDKLYTDNLKRNHNDYTQNIYADMNTFKLHKTKVQHYLSKRRETIHIDGNHSFETVKTSIWSKLELHRVGIVKQK